MATGADFDAQHVAFDGRARLEGMPASAMDGNSVVIGVDPGLHEFSNLSWPVCAGTGKCGVTAASLGHETIGNYTAISRERKTGAFQELRGTGGGLRGGNVGGDLVRVQTFDAAVVYGGDNIVVGVTVGDAGVVEGESVERRREQRIVGHARGRAAVNTIPGDDTGTGIPRKMNRVLGGWRRWRRRRRSRADSITSKGDGFRRSEVCAQDGHGA